MKFPFKKSNRDSDNENGSEANNINGFFSKIGDFFNPEPQKEKVLRHEDFNRAGDVYYATVSASYKISQRIFVLLLVIFLIFSLITNFREITYENFFYLLKDFSAAVDTEDSVYDTLSYDSNTRHFFCLYRGGLAVVNPSNISVFTATGRQTLKSTSKFSSPCVVSSDKYFIIYDTSGTTFSVYNSFSRIYNETLDYPVTNAAFDDNGNMLIITKDTSHKSIVYLYDKNFKRVAMIPYSEYAFDVAINGEYDKMAVSYYGIGNGSGRTEIVARTLSNIKEEFATISVDGEFLLDSGFIADERFAVITDRSIKIYDKYFEEIEAFEYNNALVSGYEISEQGIAVSYTENSQNIAIVFDKSGNLLYNEVINDNIKDIGIFDDNVFLRTDTGVKRINVKTHKEDFLVSGQGKMLIYSADTVLVCGDSKAEYLVFDD